ncbi:MAG: DUF4157 domain-containing protein [Cellulophaga sp.]
MPKNTPKEHKPTQIKEGQPSLSNNTCKTAHSFSDQRPATKQVSQLQNQANYYTSKQIPIQKKVNNTGLPDQLKSGIENLSGYAMDDVKVHYNSPKPAQLQAHAYAQGTDIHLASGQEKHLPHEAWHVVQQKQGRVKPTLQMKSSININTDPALEKEADVMGEKANAIQFLINSKKQQKTKSNSNQKNIVIQPMLACYTMNDVQPGKEDPSTDFENETILNIRYQRPSSMHYTKTDGDDAGSIKHYVPHQWICKNLINSIEGLTRQEAIGKLTLMLGVLGLTLPALNWKTRIGFDVWVETAFDNICDWEENLYKHSDSSGDGAGTKIDEPNDAGVKARVDAAKAKLEAIGLGTPHLHK